MSSTTKAESADTRSIQPRYPPWIRVWVRFSLGGFGLLMAITLVALDDYHVPVVSSRTAKKRDCPAES